MTNKLSPKKRKKGFLLIEALVSIAIFLIIIWAASTTLVTMIHRFNDTANLQKDLEEAQYALNLMSKVLRTSSVISSKNGAVKAFDYSQDQCLEYRISGGTLWVAQSADDKSNCLDDDLNLPGSSPLIAGGVSGDFGVTSTDGSDLSPTKTMGKVTVNLVISEGNDQVKIQSTVSLRDYREIQFSVN